MQVRTLGPALPGSGQEPPGLGSQQLWGSCRRSVLLQSISLSIGEDTERLRDFPGLHSIVMTIRNQDPGSRSLCPLLSSCSSDPSSEWDV